MTHQPNTSFAIGDEVRATRPEYPYGYIYDDGIIDSIGRLKGGNRVLFIKFKNGQVRRFHSDFITKYVSHRTTDGNI